MNPDSRSLMVGIVLVVAAAVLITLMARWSVQPLNLFHP